MQNPLSSSANNPQVFANPMKVVALARMSHIWPEHLMIPLESLALYQQRDDWQEACQECRDHGTIISLEGSYYL